MDRSTHKTNNRGGAVYSDPSGGLKISLRLKNAQPSRCACTKLLRALLQFDYSAGDNMLDVLYLLTAAGR